MNKPTIVVSCPIDTYSGYGGRSRDFVKALIELDKYNIQILPQRWGETRWGYLKDHNLSDIASRIVTQLTQQPDIWVQVSIPNEFQKVGKFNIGLTAGIETTLCDPSWIKGANNMDLLLVSSNHAKESFLRSKFEVADPKTEQVKERIQLNTKMEVLFEGIDLTKLLPSTDKTDITETLDSIPESFCFFTTGHWMQGDLGEDRKNIGFTIKAFLETFKNKPNAPALVMKVHSMTTSIMDRERILDKIDEVRKTVKGSLPNIYLIHGEISDKEMNSLYNHPKIKAFVSLPKGEGFGRPFLEFSLTNKPIIASAWSGQTDFLDREFVRYVKGDLTNVHKSAAVQNIILPESQWFTPDPVDVGKAFKDVYKNYKDWKIKAKRQGHKSRTEFSYEKMVETLDTIVSQNVPDIPQQVALNLPKLNLPKLKKVGEDNQAPSMPTLKLPKLKKL
jgi:glycosyltransferase involved in cell wall biosynthesis